MAWNEKMFAKAYWLAPRAIMGLAAGVLWAWAALSWVAGLRQGIHPSLIEWGLLILGPLMLGRLVFQLIRHVRRREAQGS